VCPYWLKGACRYEHAPNHCKFVHPEDSDEESPDSRRESDKDRSTEEKDIQGDKDTDGLMAEWEAKLRVQDTDEVDRREILALEKKTKDLLKNQKQTQPKPKAKRSQFKPDTVTKASKAKPCDLSRLKCDLFLI